MDMLVKERLLGGIKFGGNCERCRNVQCLECKSIYECILSIAGLEFVHGFAFNVQTFTVRSTNPIVQEIILIFEIIPLPRSQGDVIDG